MSDPVFVATHRASMPAHARWMVSASACMALVVGLNVGALGPSLPVLRAALHAPLAWSGVLLGASFAGSLLATLGLGPLLDRGAPRPFMIGGAGLLALGLILLVFATNLPEAAAALGLAGIGGGTNSIGSAVLTARVFAGQGGRALSLINMSFGLGAFIGPLAAAAVLGAAHDFRPLFIGIAAVLLVPGTIYAMCPLPGPSTPVAHGHTPLRGARVAVGALSLLAFLYLGTEIGFGGWAFTYLRQTSAVDVTVASGAAATYWLALSLSSLGAAIHPRSWRPDRLVLVCSIGACAMVLAFLVARNMIAIEVLAAAALGFFLGPIYPLSLANAASLVPPASGRVAALVIASAQCGGSVLPWLQGFLLTAGPTWGMFMILLTCAGMAGTHYVFMRRRGLPAGWR